jgi:hypothetical protein
MTKDEKPQPMMEALSAKNLIKGLSSASPQTALASESKGLSSAKLQTALASESLKSGDQSSEPKPNLPADKSSSDK